MSKPAIGLAACLVFITLGGAACSVAKLRTHIVSAVVTGGVSLTNEPENSLAEISSSAQVVYLSAQVANPTVGTGVRVKWLKLPSQVLVTEDFSGNRSASNIFEFDRTKSLSSLASRLVRQDISWETGEYRAEVWLGRALAKTVFFRVVADAEASQLSAQRIVAQITLSDTMDDQNHLGTPKLTFSRATNTIYVQVELTQPTGGAEVQTSIRYVKTDQVITTFTAVPTMTDPLVFALSRERFGRLWSDKLWPVGTFEVITRIGGITARAQTFQIV